MPDKQYYSTSEAAKILGVSRIAVFNRIKKGQLKAAKFGRNYLIEKDQLPQKRGAPLSNRDKELINKAVDKTIKEYGQTLKLLANDQS
ncbi:MAG: hypothetical protein COY66_00945 [Candidatus Kerfeldbacteria bacterium CG_4_10_14_0_8_um_filter_42_10]|uniref:Helix-turn-helix domain-containing protein n=1 Tax=Candidatus Kerfeldbacteria bacterium CG_4_10_14_0_8_um_filter_42_10 TaxID=2014248 RepID=A0A2M7RK76_9BACT|nr:MAG: hypothetical protein COY66_00945 [Candidatus Kerfeldbacteria bacterium CG_4_10_14_0_8_um_filter_42_10]